MTQSSGIVVATLLAGCALLPVGGTITVAVHGRDGWEPETDLVLQIGDQTFEGFGGVVSAQIGTPSDVYVIDRLSCESRIGFRADPGSRHLIRLDADNVESRELLADEPMDAGPLLEAAPPLDCPAR